MDQNLTKVCDTKHFAGVDLVGSKTNPDSYFMINYFSKAQILLTHTIVECQRERKELKRLNNFGLKKRVK